MLGLWKVPVTQSAGLPGPSEASVCRPRECALRAGGKEVETLKVCSTALPHLEAWRVLPSA